MCGDLSLHTFMCVIPACILQTPSNAGMFPWFGQKNKEGPPAPFLAHHTMPPTSPTHYARFTTHTHTPLPPPPHHFPTTYTTHHHYLPLTTLPHTPTPHTHAPRFLHFLLLSAQKAFPPFPTLFAPTLPCLYLQGSSLCLTALHPLALPPQLTYFSSPLTLLSPSPLTTTVRHFS